MGYTPDNNPYIPGDPYSYDLKWQVDKIKYMQARFDELDEQVQEATDQADRAEQEADRAAGRADFATEEADRATEEADRAAGRADFATEEADRATEEADRAESEADRSKNYADTIADPVSGLVASWLAQHITQPTTPAIDNTLSVSGAAADAKVAGSLINADYYAKNLAGSIYATSMHYANGVAEAGAYILSKSFCVKNAKRVNMTIYSTGYYDIYDFIDENGIVLDFIREGATDQIRSYDILVPDNAVMLVLNGTAANYEQSVITAYFPASNAIVPHSADPVLNEFSIYNNSKIHVANQVNNITRIYYVKNAGNIRIAGTGEQNTYAYVFLDAQMNTIQAAEHFNPSVLYQSAGGYTVDETVPADAFYLAVTQNRNSSAPVITLNEDIERAPDNNSIKKIIWYGTSIPAGGYIGEGNANSYPMRIGSILKSNVINKSVGSSCVSCKDPARISAGNPYGFVTDFELCSRCLTNTIEEMQWIIQHYDDTSVFTTRTVAEMTEELEQQILSFSYENALLPYLTNAAEPQLFVFDHGFNDATAIKTREQYYDQRTALTGTKLQGWYLAGVHQVTVSYLSIRYDVSAYDYIHLTADIGPYYDVYDLFDSNDNYLRSVRNGYANKHFSDYINVSDAAYIIVSTGDTAALDTVSCDGMPYGDPDKNLYTFRGAMGFLFGLILNYSPFSRIVMIGHYENDRSAEICEYQQKVADHWLIPIFKQWNKYGWSQRIINTGWWWNSAGYAVPSGTVHATTMLHANIPDDIHPHSDASGRALRIMAASIAAWLKNEIFTDIAD